MDREAWRAAVHGVTKNWTRLSNWTELNDKIATDDVKKQALGRARDHDTGGQISIYTRTLCQYSGLLGRELELGLGIKGIGLNP